ncbi:Type 1 glutamine amidotransferase-like domain-containing protein [Clostridium algidicarnis]|uniref:Dipeptidase E n=1 Tax=Clostridium algidicarnis DSM 15099 TaxID=1121295 RepID=A0A2S6FUJ4_9CLOT|nr:Type 1 glutamine amidotransferase-like domain-containing protein [Clostridium algidicarnis]PPK43674.1 dipeptidase E [Clostridium algidicarnis DSM 15099]
MMVKILTSRFPNGFPDDFSKLLRKYIKAGMNLAFVASEFENIYEKTDWYCNHFLKMFSDCGITFGSVDVIDSRMSREIAQDTVKNADVLWLAGGDTPIQFAYLGSYGLIPYISKHKGVIIGMSAGSINMAKVAVCTLTCKHSKLEIYEALGLVEFSVEPHFDKDNINDELLVLSEKYQLYGMCDDSAIICTEDNTLYIGDIFLIDNRCITRVF